MTFDARPSFTFPLGATLVEEGIDMAVYSETADLIEFCSFDESGTETRTPLTQRTGHPSRGPDWLCQEKVQRFCKFPCS